MNKKISLLNYLLIVCIGVFSFVSVATAGEIVESFEAEYEIQPDGSVQVTERIVYDFGNNERRGIFRDLLTTHQQNATVWYKDRVLSYDRFFVTRNGVSEPYVIEDIYQGKRVRIGSPDITHTGSHEYKITYVVDGALSYYEDGSVELYWNATGDGWTVPIEGVNAEVLETHPVRILPNERSCYTGRTGDTDRCESGVVEGEGVFFTVSTLQPREQLTIAVAVDPNTVDENIVEYFIFHPLALLYVISVLVFITYTVLRVRRWQNKDNTNQSIVVQYNSPLGFNPLYTQAFYFGQLSHSGLIAGLITLAQQGFIHFHRIQEDQAVTLLGRTLSNKTVDYEISLKRDSGLVNDPYLSQVIRVFFADATTAPQKVRMSEVVKQRSRTVGEFVQLRTAINNSIMSKDNNYFVQDFPKREFRLYFLIVIFFAVSSFLGMYWLLFFSPIILFVMFIFGVYLFSSTRNSRRRTGKGYEVLRHIEGFKKFLCLTERERLQFHNAPAKNPETYMKYLPYAIALGVEKEWAVAFQDITIPEQDWYSGATARSAFSGQSLASELSSFTRIATTSPQQSSSSRGSSGRGSSGGGSGGGGGGSW